MHKFKAGMASVVLISTAVLAGCSNTESSSDNAPQSASSSTEATPSQDAQSQAPKDEDKSKPKSMKVEKTSDSYQAFGDLVKPDAPTLEEWRKNHSDSPLGTGEVLLDGKASESKTWKIDKALKAGEKVSITVLCETGGKFSTSLGKDGKFSLFSAQGDTCKSGEAKTITTTPNEQDLDSWTFNVYMDKATDFRAIVTKAE